MICIDLSAFISSKMYHSTKSITVYYYLKKRMCKYGKIAADDIISMIIFS